MDVGCFTIPRRLRLCSMTSALLLVLSAWAVLIDYGWQPTVGGGHEYIIQVQPELIDTFRAEGFSSEIPPQVQDIRRIRIVVGDEKLPRETASGKVAPDGGEQRTAATWQTLNGASDTSSRRTGNARPQYVELTQIGLALAVAAVLFLVWVHLGMRARYREFLRQSHA